MRKIDAEGLGRLVESKLPKGMGFMLLVAREEDSEISCASNIQRSQWAKFCEEWTALFKKEIKSKD